MSDLDDMESPTNARRKEKVAFTPLPTLGKTKGARVPESAFSVNTSVYTPVPDPHPEAWSKVESLARGGLDDHDLDFQALRDWEFEEEERIRTEKVKRRQAREQAEREGRNLKRADSLEEKGYRQHPKTKKPRRPKPPSPTLTTPLASPTASRPATGAGAPARGPALSGVTSPGGTASVTSPSGVAFALPGARVSPEPPGSEVPDSPTRTRKVGTGEGPAPWHVGYEAAQIRERLAGGDLTLAPTSTHFGSTAEDLEFRNPLAQHGPLPPSVKDPGEENPAAWFFAAGKGLARPVVAPKRKGSAFIPPVPTKLPDYLGPNKFAQEAHRQLLLAHQERLRKLAEEAFELPQTEEEEDAPRGDGEEYVLPEGVVPLETVVTVSQPRRSQTLPIDKSDPSMPFWTRKKVAFDSGDFESSEEEEESEDDEDDEDDEGFASSEDEDEDDAVAPMVEIGESKQADDGGITEEPSMEIIDVGGGVGMPSMGGSQAEPGAVPRKKKKKKKKKKKPSAKQPRQHTEKPKGAGWWWHEDWAVMDASQRLYRLCACHIIVQHKPAWLERMIYRYHVQQLRKDDAAARKARQWALWKKNNPCYYRMMTMMGYLIARALPLTVFVFNIMVLREMLVGRKPGWFAVHLIVFLAQFIMVAVLMGRVLKTMVKHKMDDAAPAVERVVSYGKKCYVALGPFIMLVFDVGVLVRFLFSPITGDLVNGYWRLRSFVSLLGSTILFVLNANVVDVARDDPDAYFFVREWLMIAAAGLNLFNVLVSFLMIRHQAQRYHQRVLSYMKELLYGGISPLPHYAAMRDGAISKVDYEGVITDSDDMVTLYKALVTTQELGTLDSLHHLSLRRCWLTDEGCKPLQSILELKGSGLSTLLLDYNFVRSQGAFRLARSLKTNRSVTHLSLFENEIGDLGMKYLCEGLRNNAFVAHLDLSYNTISDKSMDALVELLEANATINTLGLAGNAMTGKGIEKLAGALKFNSSVEHLDLSHTPVGDLGLEALAGNIKSKDFCNLKTLLLNHSSVGDDGVLELMAAIKTNTTLVRLELSDNPVTGAVGVPIGVGIGASRSLEIVDISGLMLGDKPVNAIIGALETNEHLLELDVSGNNLHSAVVGFVEVIQLRNTTLKTLVLGGNDVRKEYAAEVRAKVGSRITFQMWK